MHMHASQTFITETCNNNYHLLEDVQKHTNEKKPSNLLSLNVDMVN